MVVTKVYVGQNKRCTKPNWRSTTKRFYSEESSVWEQRGDMLTSRDKNTGSTNNAQKLNSSKLLPYKETHIYTHMNIKWHTGAHTHTHSRCSLSALPNAWFPNKTHSLKIDSNIFHNLHLQGTAGTHTHISLLSVYTACLDRGMWPSPKQKN